jgi:putative flavoprotein involved in K+ transport
VEPERREAVVIGAGPAGLAAAALLRREGIDTLVLERGEIVGARWRDRYDRLHLHTVRWLSGLPGYPIPRSFGKWPSRDAVVRYLDDYARHHRLDVRRGVDAERIDPRDGGWRIATPQGAIDAEHVVVATGYNAEPVIPAWPGRDSFAGAIVHSHEYRNPEPYRGQDVIVVGSGNSAAEIAVDVHEGGASRVRLSVRTPPHIVKRDTLGLPVQIVGIALTKLPPAWVNRIGLALRKVAIPDLAPYGLPIPDEAPATTFARKSMIPIVDVGIVRAVRTQQIAVIPSIERFQGEEIVLADGTRTTADAIVAGTGFRAALDGLVGHLGVLDDKGLPAAMTPARGLHFIGFTVTLGGALRKVGFEARDVARAVAAERAAGSAAAESAPAAA